MEAILNIEVVDAVVVSASSTTTDAECESGKLCSPEDYFDTIEKCRRCGRLS